MACGVPTLSPLQFLFILLLTTSICKALRTSQVAAGGSLVLRRELGNFQVCAVCTCCGGPKRVCLASPCCYAINCNIPNRPFGYCSFTPKSCNCLGCHI